MKQNYTRSRSQTSSSYQRRSSNSRDSHASSHSNGNYVNYSSDQQDDRRNNSYSSNQRNSNYSNSYASYRRDNNYNNNYTSNQRGTTNNANYSNNRRNSNYNGYSNNRRSTSVSSNISNNSNTSNTSGISSNGITRSTRNWDAENARLTSVEKLPLLSRSDNPQAISGHILKDPSKQMELWRLIKNMAKQAEESGRKEVWDDTVKQLRKLREVVFSTMGDRKNMDFVIEVFELSVITCIKANNDEELFKCFKRLVEEIYVMSPVSKNDYFTALYALYIKCKRQDHVYAETLMQELSKDNEFARYAYNVLDCTKKNRSNSFKYFVLSNNPPTNEYAAIIHNYDDIVRVESINIIRKAYLSASAPWLRKWLGLSKECDVIHEIKRLQQGDCVKSFDQSRDLIYFLKKKVN